VGMNADASDISTETGLANKWEQADDLMSWTISLRPGVQWDQGYGEVTADDVKFSLERVMAEDSRTTYAGTLRNAIQEIQVVDPHTLKFVLKAPFVILPYQLSAAVGNEAQIVSKAYVEKVGDQAAAENPVGSGPYRLVKQEPGQSYQFEARPDYWGGKPKFQQVFMYKIPEESTRLAMLKAGQLDVAEVTIPQIAGMEQAGFKVYEKSNANSAPVYFESQWDKTKPLSDVRVRKAFNLAVNKDEMNKTLFDGKAKVYGAGTRYPYAPGLKDIPPYPYDPEQAKALLKEAGFDTNQTITFYTLNSDPLPLMAQAVAGYLADVGVKTTIVPIDQSVWVQKAKEHSLNDMFNTLASDKVFGTAGLQGLFTSKGIYHMVEDPALDTLINDAATAPNTDKIAEQYGKIQQYMADNYTALELLSLGQYFAADSSKIGTWNGGGKAASDIGMRQLVLGN